MNAKIIGTSKPINLTPDDYASFGQRLRAAAEKLQHGERESVMRTALLCDLISVVLRLSPKNRPPLFELVKHGKVLAHVSLSALTADDLGIFMGAGYSFRFGDLEI